MGYGSANEDERMLSYSPKQVMTAAPVAPSASLPPNIAGGPTSAHPSEVKQPDPAAVSRASPHVAVDVMGPATANRFVSYARQIWQDCRPWKEFYSTKELSRPHFHDLSDRFAANLHDYRANYQVIAAFWLGIVLLGSIHSLLFAGLGFWLLEKWCTRVAAKNGGHMQHKHKITAAFLALLVVWLTSIGSYTVQSLILSSISIALHGIFHTPDTVETEIATV